MAFMITAETPSGFVSEMCPHTWSAMMLAQNWASRGYRDVRIRDDAGTTYDVAVFRFRCLSTS
ncbi:hypothetical protein [Methylobacterium gregans]|uniref:Uncharacterized protein n=1 Tax=Methylobacterium gregans TaxID=374424 RepID=A0AA37HZH7_9HYPH|nr:hypothetical protein [Methylobacterium gregans]MDQ0524121.1 hypothetical protein [Methylobacterium gregans]GJD82132.1 hypothetical protein NBEOAGPD_5392 [Methylobacterium gregans]GLS57278.1 hypothetical protein GCM10007886_54640 [Methylobacterium gregans]